MIISYRTKQKLNKRNLFWLNMRWQVPVMFLPLAYLGLCQTQGRQKTMKINEDYFIKKLGNLSSFNNSLFSILPWQGHDRRAEWQWSAALVWECCGDCQTASPLSRQRVPVQAQAGNRVIWRNFLAVKTISFISYWHQPVVRFCRMNRSFFLLQVKLLLN